MRTFLAALPEWAVHQKAMYSSPLHYKARPSTTNWLIKIEFSIDCMKTSDMQVLMKINKGIWKIS